MKPRAHNSASLRAGLSDAVGTGSAGNVFFIVGPTCSGKSEVAQCIAGRGNYDILSADSMLVYKGMDIGTAKPGVAERHGVRYFGIDLVTVREHFSAGMYREAALAAIALSASSGRDMIVAGGTGLYIKALVEGLSAGGRANAGIRRTAERLFREEGVEALEGWLSREDRALYESLSDRKNPRRLVRALERALSKGASKEVRWSRAADGPPVPGLRYPPEQMKKRVERRARRMFSSGLIEEVERLLEEGLDSAPTARHAIGYAEAIDHMRGRCSLEEAVERTMLRTLQLVKRQYTWFRNQANVRWVDCEESMSAAMIAGRVLECWASLGPTPIAGLRPL